MNYQENTKQIAPAFKDCLCTQCPEPRSKPAASPAGWTVLSHNPRTVRGSPTGKSNLVPPRVPPVTGRSRVVSTSGAKAQNTSSPGISSREVSYIEKDQLSFLRFGPRPSPLFIVLSLELAHELSEFNPFINWRLLILAANIFAHSWDDKRSSCESCLWCEPNWFQIFPLRA